MSNFPKFPADQATFTAGDGIQYIYNLTGNYWTRIGVQNLGGGTSISQVTKLGVVASSSAPKVVDATITSTTSFTRTKLEVLKFTPAATGKVETIATFDNGTSADFVADPLNQVQFSSTTMSLLNSSIQTATPTAFGSNFQFSFTLDDINNYKMIESLVVS